MSARFVLMSSMALVFAFPVMAQPKQLDPVAALRKTLAESKMTIPAKELVDVPVFEVLQKLSRDHKISFVIMEEQFAAAKVQDFTNAKSPLKRLETKDLAVGKFLNVWLTSLGASYVVRPDYVEIVPLARPGVAGPANEPRPDPLPELVQKLHTEEVQLQGNINDIPLFELLQRFSKDKGLNFVINEESFRQEGVQDIRDKKPTISATQLRGMMLHQFLTATLNSMGATYIITGNAIEIVTPTYAAKMAKVHVLTEPLVTAVFKERPLNEAVAQLAERYDLTVIVSPQAGDARLGFVTARLMNVPADKAIELLALQADLRVVRKGAAFLITTRDQADTLFQEQMGREHAKIELQKLREAPLPRPGQQPPGQIAPGPQPATFQLLPKLQPGGGIELKLVPPKKP